MFRMLCMLVILCSIGCNRSTELTYPELVTAIEGETKELERMQELVKSLERGVEKTAKELRESVLDGRRQADKNFRSAMDDLPSASSRDKARKDWEQSRARLEEADKQVSAGVKELRDLLAIKRKPIDEEIEKQKAILDDLRNRRDQVRK